MEQKVQSARDEAVTPPSIEELGKAAEDIVWRVMGKGSAKSAYGEWFHVDKPVHDYHIARAIRHLATAQMMLHKSVPMPDGEGEDAMDHLERAVVRALFCWAQTKKELPRI